MTSNNVKFIINIEIDDRSHRIVLNPFEDAKQVAKTFVNNEQLDTKLVDSLTDHIKTFLLAANQRAVNRLNFEKNFENLSRKTEEEDYNYSLHDSGLTQPDATLGGIKIASEIEPIINEEIKPSSVKNSLKKSHFGRKTEKNITNQKTDKKTRAQFNSEKKQLISQKNNNIDPTKSPKVGKMLQKNVATKKNKRTGSIDERHINNKKDKMSYMSSSIVETYSTKDKIVEKPENRFQGKDLFEKNHCLKNLNKTKKEEVKLYEDIENKRFYQPTTSYINKLIAENSPDGTIDMELIKKHYDILSEAPHNVNAQSGEIQHRSIKGLRNTNRRAQSASRPIRSINDNQFLEQFNQRFYYKELNKLKAKQQYVQDMQTLKELEKEKETYSFKPQVNRVSDVLARERRPDNTNVEDYLLERGKETYTRRLNSEVAEKWQKDNEFDFKPKINRQSEEMNMRRSLANPKVYPTKYDELYDLAITKKKEMTDKVFINPDMVVKASNQSNCILYNSELPLDFLKRQNYLDQKLKQHKMDLELIHKPAFRPQLVSKSVYLNVRL